MTRLTPAVNISSSVALSNLLSGSSGGPQRLPNSPAVPVLSGTANAIATAHANAPSPKRRLSDGASSGSSDAYYQEGRPRKSPRPNPSPSAHHQQQQAIASVKLPSVNQADSAISAGGPEHTTTTTITTHQQQSHLQAQSSQRHAQARMRSSIACVRCRRSKVKCVNSGVGTPCRSCEAGGRECTYPVPVTGGRRREGSLSGPLARPEGLGDDQVNRAVT